MKIRYKEKVVRTPVPVSVTCELSLEEVILLNRLIANCNGNLGSKLFSDTERILQKLKINCSNLNIPKSNYCIELIKVEDQIKCLAKGITT